MNTKLLLGSALMAFTLAEEVPMALAQPQEARYEYAIQRTAAGEQSAQFVPVVQRRRRYYRSSNGRRVYVRRRSARKSAAIVGGSALGGAAIGALAGGGKGAAIGAVAGGGAGLVYDRATHKKVYR